MSVIKNEFDDFLENVARYPGRKLDLWFLSLLSFLVRPLFISFFRHRFSSIWYYNIIQQSFSGFNCNK